MTDEFVTPTAQETIDALDDVRICAREVLRGLKLSLGGDCFEYHGSMNDVEDLRAAITAAERLHYRLKDGKVVVSRDRLMALLVARCQAEGCSDRDAATVAETRLRSLIEPPQQPEGDHHA